MIWWKATFQFFFELFPNEKKLTEKINTIFPIHRICLKHDCVIWSILNSTRETFLFRFKSDKKPGIKNFWTRNKTSQNFIFTWDITKEKHDFKGETSTLH